MCPCNPNDVSFPSPSGPSGPSLPGFGLPSSLPVPSIPFPDGFPEDLGTIKAPAISIDHEFTRNEPFQLGPGKKDIRRYSIVVYGRLKGERDDLGQLVYEFFDHTMDIYDQNILLTGGSYVKLGYADFDNVIQRSVTDPTLQALKYQMNISLEAEVIIDSGSSLV